MILIFESCLNFLFSVRTTQKPHRSKSGIMYNDDSDDEDKGSVDRLDAIHRRMRPKSEVDLVFAQRAQVNLTLENFINSNFFGIKCRIQLEAHQMLEIIV